MKPQNQVYIYIVIVVLKCFCYPLVGCFVFLFGCLFVLRDREELTMYFCLFIVRDEIVEDLEIEKKLPGMKFLYIKKSSIFLPFISLNMFLK